MFDGKDKMWRVPVLRLRPWIFRHEKPMSVCYESYIIRDDLEQNYLRKLFVVQTVWKPLGRKPLGNLFKRSIRSVRDLMVKFTKKDCEAYTYTYIHSTTHIPIGAHSFCTLGQHKSFTLFIKYYGCLKFWTLEKFSRLYFWTLIWSKVKNYVKFFC